MGSELKDKVGKNQNGYCQRGLGLPSSNQNCASESLEKASVYLTKKQTVKEHCERPTDDSGKDGVSNAAFLSDDSIDYDRQGSSHLGSTSSRTPLSSSESSSGSSREKPGVGGMARGKECAGSSPPMESQKEFCALSVNSSGINRNDRKHSENSSIGCKKEPQRINIVRDAMDLQELHSNYAVEPEHVPLYKKLLSDVKSKCMCNLRCLITLITSIFPIITWLPKYKIKEDLILDIIAGFTVAIIHIPQGMAYALLASSKPVIGLYVSFFPVIVYSLMGTSKHISIGTFAVISLMVKSTIEKIKSNSVPLDRVTNETVSNLTATTIAPVNEPSSVTDMNVFATMAFAVGVWQIIMAIFHLGGFTVILSDHLISGFSTGAACHVATSQIPDLFAIKTKGHSGPLKLIYTYIDIFGSLKQSNLATVIISATSIFALALVKEQINARFRSKLKLPVPIDLLVVILGTLASYFGNFNKKYGVIIMGNIPTGLPAPSSPDMELLPKIISDSFAVAVVAYVITLSLAKIFAKKHKYPINANQELVALGSSNILSSFFSCFPCSASLSRSSVQERAGGKTQVTGLVSCGFLLIVLLWLAPFFYDLPKCVLSAIVLVALKGMFLQVSELKKAWYISRIDALIWLLTFIAVVLLDVDYGLLAGLIFAALSVVYRTSKPSVSFLGKLPNTELYLDVMRYNKAIEIKGVIIFHFESALYFANRESFRHTLLKQVSKTNSNINFKAWPSHLTLPIHHVIIDCSSFSYIDMSGVETLLELYTELKEMGITVYLASCSVPVYEFLVKTGYLQKTSYPSVFPSIHDAVHHCQ